MLRKHQEVCIYLENVEILGFRGINRLSLVLDQNTVLIGENAWGKSSLLDALSLLLSPALPPYHFSLQDFHFTPGDETSRERHLQVIFTFCESGVGYHLGPRYRGLAPVWVKGEGRLQRIFYRLEGEVDESSAVCTWRSFLDADGQPLVLANIDVLARELIRLHPVLRLRDARFTRRKRADVVPLPVRDNNSEDLTQHLNQLMQELIRNPQRLTDQELRQGIVAMRQLLEHYFAEQGEEDFTPRHHHHARAMENPGALWITSTGC